MTAQGQPVVTYTWDASNRLTQIQQAAGTINGNTPQTITFQYDNGNRRTQTVLSNGVTVAYTYDNANRILGIAYTQSDGPTIGNLSYTYDAAGPMPTPDSVILEREVFWKRILLSRGEHGLNRN